MAILNNLIVNGAARFLNKTYMDTLNINKIEADKGKFNRLTVEDVTATNATVLGLMDVKGELHTNTWTNSNIATIDGSFYITPTIGLTDNGTANVTANAITFTGTSYSFTSIYTNEATSSTTSTVAWTAGSKILITGEVQVGGEWMPFGTLTGLLGTTSSTSVAVNTLKANRPATVTSNPETLAAIISAAAEAGVATTALPYRNVKISMYQTNRTANGTTYYPLGIYMSALGANGRTFIDIYGGNNAYNSTGYPSAMALPVVRIGNLSSMNLPKVGGITPNGWGIYTSNGFFKGTVAAEQGKIGKGAKIWTIGSDGDNRSFIFSGPSTINDTTNVGIYIGTDGIWDYKSSAASVKIKDGVITAIGANIQGQITATSFIAKDYYNSAYRTRAVVDTNGLTIYDGSGTGDINIQARFGSTVQIGRASAAHLELSSNALILKDSSNTEFFKVKDATNESGEVVNTFIGDGVKGNTSNNQFPLSYVAINNTYTVTVNDVEVTNNITKTTTGFYFNSAPATGDVIVATYNVRDNDAKGYDFGTRKSNTITGKSSVIEGLQTTASGNYSHAEGANTKANGGCAHVEGAWTIADGSYSHAEGGETIASGSMSHAEGYETKAGGTYSHAEGDNTTASGYCSHAEGRKTTASNDYSHAEGYGTTANNKYSHAEGGETTASGTYSHAEGRETTASGTYSHAQNMGTVATRRYQTVIGRYNAATASGSGTDEDPYVYIDSGNYAFIIGNGMWDDPEDRSNALTVDWDGHVVATSAKKNIMYTGEYIMLYGNKSDVSKSEGQVGLSTTAQNCLPADKYSIFKSPLADDLYSVSSGEVTILKAGRYRLSGQIYLYNGFTVNDVVYCSILSNGSGANVRASRCKAFSTALYETLSADTITNPASGTTYTLASNNGTAGRGIVGLNGYTRLMIECLGIYE